MTNLQAKRFAKIRKEHKSELAQDYVEIILDLTEEFGEARLVELATRLGVAHPTVSKALRRLEVEGLVKIDPYRPIILTSEGKRLAVECRNRHQTIASFLVALGLSENEAHAEAEGIEHHISNKTLALMGQFCRKS